jgi:hypothetical protein
MKKILYSLAVLVLIVFTFNFSIVTKRVNNVSSVALQNIEALSYAETTGQQCFFDGSVDCPVSKVKVKIVY